MPSNAKYLKMMLKRVMSDPKAPASTRLGAIRLFGYLDGLFPGPKLTPEDTRIDQKYESPVMDMTVDPEETNLAGLVQDLYDYRDKKKS